MATVRYYLSKKVSPLGSEVLLRLSLNRSTVLRGKTGVFVPQKSWNEKNHELIIPRVRTASTLSLMEKQAELASLSRYLIANALLVDDKKITKQWLAEQIFSFRNPNSSATLVEKRKPSFFDTFELYMSQEMRTEINRKHFAGLERMLMRFQIYDGRGSLSIDSLSADDLFRFECFLREEYTFFENGVCVAHHELYSPATLVKVPERRGGNAIHAILKRLRTFCLWCVRTGRTNNNPFKGYKLHECVYGTPFFMTVEERKQLYAFDFSSRPGLATQRDIFVFQSLVGMRVGDMYCLTAANIVEDAIEYVPSKTASKSARIARVPLSPTAKEIIERYRLDNDTDHLLPFISKQRYNDAIKEMLRLAGIDRQVRVVNPTTRKEETKKLYEVASSHMARRNFVGNLYSKVQDVNLICSMTGHVEGSSAFFRYRAVDDEIKRAVLSDID